MSSNCTCGPMRTTRRRSVSTKAPALRGAQCSWSSKCNLGRGIRGVDRIVTFDCYGTLVDFDLDRVTRDILTERLHIDGVDEAEFLRDFRVMRFQAVLEEYRPYKQLLCETLEQAMRLHGMPYRKEDGDALVAAVPTFGPFREVP